MHPTEPAAPFYEQCKLLDSTDGSTRIYAPLSYPVTRRAQIIPIVHIEAIGLAHWFPICWKIESSICELVVLRSLFKDGARQPPGSPTSAGSLPLALRAYPFAVGHDDQADKTRFWLDTAVSDEPTDIGAPILMPSGKPSSGAKLKLNALHSFNDALPATREMTSSLLELGLLEPWPLSFTVEGRPISVPNLHIVRQRDVASPQMFRFLETFGASAAIFLGAHRISLYRAGILVRAAGASVATAPVTA